MITIGVSKHFDSDYVTGLINISINDGITYRVEKTSFHSYGLRDLQDSLTVKFDKISWLVKSSDKKKHKTPNTLGTDIVLVRLLKNFDRAVRQLKRRCNKRPAIKMDDEYDVQDFLHALLRGYFDDVRPEEYSPSYAGSSSRVDFLLKKEKCVVEVKVASSKLREKKIGEQLIVDIERYQKHPDCKNLYCLVYDPDSAIHNPMGLESDLSGKKGDIEVKVFVVPN